MYCYVSPEGVWLPEHVLQFWCALDHVNFSYGISPCGEIKLHLMNISKVPRAKKILLGKWRPSWALLTANWRNKQVTVSIFWGHCRLDKFKAVKGLLPLLLSYSLNKWRKKMVRDWNTFLSNTKPSQLSFESSFTLWNLSFAFCLLRKAQIVTASQSTSSKSSKISEDEKLFRKLRQPEKVGKKHWIIYIQTILHCVFCTLFSPVSVGLIITRA